MGLKLSEDGQNWIPIETESTNIPGEGVQTFPDDYEPSSALALLEAASLGVSIGMSLVFVFIIASILVPVLGFLVLLWLFFMAIGMGPIESMAHILGFFG
ncbi:hypothetical protein N9J16_00500 [Candidatus Poseidoniaceae archaeon]|nr:hypothetical protein [Candidatus Poseidoniaceae archaeon]|tara:strand:+ start:19172 stop:19471 length:300 start_codon:yes stop_codon:yes gene_type:complete